MPALPQNPIVDIIGGGKDIIDGGKEAIGGVIDTGKDIIGGIGDGVVNVGKFVSDPAGYIFDLLKAGAKGLAHDVLPALAHATEPDLAADWFLNAYKISFATAIFVWVFLMAFQIYKVAQGSLSTRDLSEALGPQTVQFFAGAIYGPAIGWLMVKFFSSVSDVFIGWGITSAADTTVDSFIKMIDDANVGAIIGGVFVGILLMFFMILALLMTLGILIVTLVALYFTGVIFPLGWVWIVSKGHRRHGRRIATLWVGILAMHSILFFFLGFTFTMVANATMFGEWSDGLKTLVQLMVAIVAMIGAGFAPYKLMKFALVVPEGAGGQEGGQISGGGGGGGSSSYGADSPSSARDVARKSGGKSDSSPTGSDADGQGTEMSWAEPTSERKPLTNALSAMKESGGASQGGPGAPAAGGGGGAVPSPAGAGGGAVGAGAGGALGGGGGGAAAGAEGVAAAGAAESSTGVGAVVGIPTMMAAAGMAVGQKAVETSNIALDQAVGELNDDSEGYSNG